MQARRGRIVVDVCRQGLFPKKVGQPFGGVVHHAAPVEFVEDVHGTLLYQPMTISRRVVLKAVAATAAGAVVGAGSYGYFDERNELEVMRMTLPVSGLPAALDGLRVGFITDVHCSRWGPPEYVS